MKLTASHMKRLHLGLALFWLVLVVPTLLWWGSSVLWVNLMSLYAIVITHISAYQGARAEKKGEENE